MDILITNCSIFCPTPSLASMLINKFKFRRDVQSYNLGGMGCSIGVIAIGLVRDMLQVRAMRDRRSLCWPGQQHKDRSARINDYARGSYHSPCCAERGRSAGWQHFLCQAGARQQQQLWARAADGQTAP